MKTTSNPFRAANMVFGHSAVFVTNDGRTLVANATHPNFASIEKAYRAKDFSRILDLIDLPTTIQTSFGRVGGGRVRVTSHAVYFDNAPVAGVLVDRILEHVEAGADFTGLMRFLENLMANPSFSAREGLYQFLEHKNMPITEDGCFIAYKGVTNDYWSITSGTIKMLKGKVDARGRVYNAVGEELECERGHVDDNRDVGCSKGLHVGSHKYANDFRGAGRLMLVKVNPRDVVSVPKDCDCQKVRACAYVVIGEDSRTKDDSAPIANMDTATLGSYVQKPKRDALGRFC